MISDTSAFAALVKTSQMALFSCLSLMPAAACALAAAQPYVRATAIARGAAVVMQYGDADRVRSLEDKISLGRRALIPAIALAGLSGGLVARTPSSPVIPGTETYSEMSRLTVTPRAAEAACNKYFPGALGGYTMDRLTAQTLGARGYTKDNTLFASCICPDEINFIPGEMVDLMKTRWGENFALGGLAGLPFVGKAGFSAFAHHVPAEGKAFIIFAPHVGVEADGSIGKILREHQHESSTACGAAVGAYKAILANKGPVPTADPDYDAQIGFIIEKLGQQVNDLVGAAPDPISFVTYQMYVLARDTFVKQLTEAGGIYDDAVEVAVLGGIQINRAVGGDRFMPLMFQSRKQAPGTVVDLYEETFGAPPDLREALGGTMSNDLIYKYPLGK